jgi:hypothetical protein
MRRGRRVSDGAYEEYEGTCAPDVLGAGLARAIEDVPQQWRIFAPSRGPTPNVYWRLDEAACI